MSKTIPELDHVPLYHHVLNELRGGIRLLIRGAAYELVEHHNISQPEADVKVLHILVCELDAQADLPTMLFGPVLDAIRAAIENDWADAMAEAEGNAFIERMGGDPTDPHWADKM